MKADHLTMIRFLFSMIRVTTLFNTHFIPWKISNLVLHAIQRQA